MDTAASSNEMVIWLVGLAAVIAFLGIVFGRAGRYPYVRGEPLLSPTENAFRIALERATGSRFAVFTKVRIADIIQVRKGLDRRNHTIALNKIAAKHVDFVLCDPRSYEAQIAIEVDDSSHLLRARQARDTFVDKAFHAAGVPLLRVKASGRYEPHEVAQQIELTLNPPKKASK